MSGEKASNPRVPRKQTVACLGRNCVFAAKAFGEVSKCEGATIRLLSRVCKKDADGSSGKLQYAVYTQHCPTRTEELGQADEPVGHVVHIFDETVAPVTAIQAAEALQTAEAPISLSYGASTLVNALPKEVPVRPEGQA